MADITSIDRATARLLGNEAEAALKAIAEKYGLTLTSKGGTFSSSDSTQKFVFSVEGADKEAFERYASWYGLTADDFGKTFKLSGTEYRISGINTRAPKFAIQIVRTKDNKGFKAPVESVLRALGRDLTAAREAGAI